MTDVVTCRYTNTPHSLTNECEDIRFVNATDLTDLREAWKFYEENGGKPGCLAPMIAAVAAFVGNQADDTPAPATPAYVPWAFELAMARTATNYYLDVINGRRPTDKSADDKRQWQLARLGEAVLLASEAEDGEA